MKRILTFALMALFVAGQMATAQVIWDGTTDTEWLGTGTQADPYQISTPQELAGLAEVVNNKTKDFAGEYICLTADIYLNAETTPDSLKLEWPRIGGITREQHGEDFVFDSTIFRGNFDGRDHIIHGVHYEQMPADSTGWDDPFVDFAVDFTGWERGFFGYLQDATVENLKLHNLTIMAGPTLGGLSPYAVNCTIRNIHITDSKVMSSLGDYGGGAAGLVHESRSTLIENCTVDARVQGTRSVGVLAGYADSASVIRDCSTSGYAYMSQYDCGGFIGQNYGLIERCSSSADVSRGSYLTASVVDCAGFVGDNCGTIRDCYATGNVVQSHMHGAGFCGRNQGRIESCYSTGDVEVVDKDYGSVYAFLGANGNIGTYGNPDYPGEVINCFGTGACTIVDDDNYCDYYYGFFGSSACPGVSLVANCYFDVEKNPRAATKTYGEFDVTTAYLQSQAFVDTLNMMAALKGLTKWQYNAGGYPTLTTEKATNITDYFAGGSGTKDDPYRIETKEHLKNFAKYVNHGYHFAGDYLLQTADIALNPPFEKWGEEMPELWEKIGTAVVGHNTIAQEHTYNYFFCGTYDGGLHEIQNLYCYSLTTPQGLFGTLYHNANIRNLGVTDAWILGNGNSGILAAIAERYAMNIDIRNCWTSGTIEDKGWGAGGILGSISLEGNNNILNCFSSAVIKGSAYSRPVVGDQNYIGGETYSNDTVGNFFYYGKAIAFSDAIAGNEITQNYFFNLDSVSDLGSVGSVGLAELGGRNTAYLHSKEFVNTLNYYVSDWNATHSTPLLYWQHRENDYPFYTTSVPEHYTITFVTNGGTDVTPQCVLPESKMVVPAVPTKEGDLFAGWYADEALTEVFDVEQLITSDITLYARWVKADYDADYSIFGNPFATAYVIKTKEQLNALRHIVNGTTDTYSRDILTGKTIKLGNDIVLNDTTDWQHWGKTASATPWTPIGLNEYISFNYTFDGQGYKIIGLYATTPGLQYVGLFGYIGAEASVKNLGVVAAYVESDAHVGALAGSSAAPITNCYAHARGTNPLSNFNDGKGYLGLLVGAASASFTNCYAIGELKGIDCIGGLVGRVDLGVSDTIRHCYAHANIEGRNSVGGLIGATNSLCVVEECYAKGNIVLSAEHVTTYYRCENVGGLIGSAQGDINNCYAMGSIRSEGGLTGSIAGWLSTKIRNCYYVGNVQAINYDGLAYGYSRNKENSYYNKDYPIVAEITTSDTIFGRTTAQMKTYETYATWDFGDVWGMRATYNDGYPYLRAFAPEEWRNEVEYLQLDADSIIIQLNDTHTLTATILPKIDVAVEWVSTHPEVAQVADGVITPVAVGATEIVVRTVDGAFADTCKVTVVAVPTSLVVLPADTVVLINSTFQLRAQVLPMDADQRVVWSTNVTEDYMTIDENGLVTTKQYARNNVYIYAETVVGELRDTVTLKIVRELPATSITFDKHALSVKIGETATLTATVLPNGTTLAAAHWKADNNSYADWRVSGNICTITGYQAGTTTIVAARDGVSDTCVVTVVDPNKVTSVVLDVNEVTLNVGETATITATVLPAGITLSADNWRSTDDWYVASVSATGNTATITAIGAGTAEIIVEKDGVSDTCKVTVVDPSKVAGVELDVHELTLEIGQTYTLTATVLPETAENKNVRWYADDSGVVSVDRRDGVITAEQVGTAAVWVETRDGYFTDTCYVTVVEAQPEIIPVTGITLSETALTLAIGDTHVLTATVAPTNATNTNYTWSSSAASIVSVDNVGKLTACAEGTATITVTTEDGGKTAMCDVTVSKPEPVVVPVVGIALSETALTLEIGDTHEFVATISPADATNQDVNWVSTNTWVVTVEDGFVTAIGEGIATIIATTVDGGKTAMCNVTVEKAEDPNPTECENVVYSETFAQSLGEFTVVNNTGQNDWYYNSGYSCAYVNGYTSGANDDWLISPAFDLRHKEKASVAFTHATAYGNAATKGNHCMVKVSADYAGDVNTATWHTVDGVTFASSNWIWSEQLLAIPEVVLGEAKVVVAFHYNITSADDAPAWEVKEFVFEAVCQATDIENTYMDCQSSVQKVLENGQVIIIRDGVRYNVLGVRLANPQGRAGDHGTIGMYGSLDVKR